MRGGNSEDKAGERARRLIKEGAKEKMGEGLDGRGTEAEMMATHELL